MVNNEMTQNQTMMLVGLGIGIGSGILLLCIILLAIWLCKRRVRARYPSLKQNTDTRQLQQFYQHQLNNKKRTRRYSKNRNVRVEMIINPSSVSTEPIPPSVDSKCIPDQHVTTPGPATKTDV